MQPDYPVTLVANFKIMGIHRNGDEEPTVAIWTPAGALHGHLNPAEARALAAALIEHATNAERTHAEFLAAHS